MEVDGTIVVWFSCGAASACALKLTIDKYGVDRVRAVNSPILEEHPDNRRFLKDVEAWAGISIELAVNPKYPEGSAVSVWSKRRYMSGVSGAPCTVELKKEARYLWEKQNSVSWHVLGFTADEKDRHARFVKTERDNVIPILIEAGMTKADCVRMIQNASIQLPRIYSLGYPNANCIGCVKATSVTYWNLVRNTFPEIFEERAKLSRELGCRLTRYKGKRIFLDELSPDAKGNQLPTHMPDCGIFCEERR